MSPPEETLKRISQGQGSFPELARALKSYSGLVMIWPAKSSVSLTSLLWSAIGEPPAPAPAEPESESEPLGERDANGLLGPYVFTTEARARAFLARTGLAPYPATCLRSQPWIGGVAHFLERGYSGMILDPASRHALALDRRGLSRLYAQLTLEHLAAQPSLRVVMINHRFHAQKSPHGAGLQAFVYDSAAAAGFGLPRLPGGGVALSTREAPTREFLRRALSAGITYLVVNPAAPGERIYDQADLERMVVAPAAGGAPDLRRKALESPPFNPWPLSGRNEEAARVTLVSLHRKAGTGALAPWQFIEALAFESDLHVAAAPRGPDGLLWPEPRAWTRAEAARRLPALHLSGLEALRWFWSAPQTGDAVVLDGSLKVPMDWAISALFPAATQIGDLQNVPVVSPMLLARLPGARALKPQALRALALHWKELVKFQERSEVEWQGQRYLPLFASLRSLDAFRARPQGFAGTPDPAGNLPPFSRWLSDAAQCSGLLLEAGSGAPLPLDHTGLLVIQRWAANPHRPPRPAEIIRDAARLLDAQILTQELAGRVAAELPHYWVARRGPELFRFPGADGCCLFAAESEVRIFLAKASTLEVDVDFQPELITSRWLHSAFLAAAAESGEVWICPEDPLFGGGLHLKPEGLRAALRCLDEKLKPRVPGFVV